VGVEKGRCGVGLFEEIKFPAYIWKTEKEGRSALLFFVIKSFTELTKRTIYSFPELYLVN